MECNTQVETVDAIIVSTKISKATNKKKKKLNVIILILPISFVRFVCTIEEVDRQNVISNHLFSQFGADLMSIDIVFVCVCVA